MRTPLDKSKLIILLKNLAKNISGSGGLYLTGGATALLYDWREMTIDLDLKPDPEPAGFFEAVAKTKIQESANIELASPDQFVPALIGWKSRSLYIATYFQIDYYHYDPYGQVLAKLERAHPRDSFDVHQFVTSGLVSPRKLRELFDEVKHECIRYPAIEIKDIEDKITFLISQHPE